MGMAGKTQAAEAANDDSKPALSNRQRKVLRKEIIKGRPRLFGVERQPNGQPSRRKANLEPEYSWLAPAIKKELNMHPVEALHKRGAITDDQKRAAFAWIADRAASGLPYICPPKLDLSGVRAAAEERSVIGAARRYNELNHLLKQRCGVFGHTIAFRTIIEGHQDEAVAQYWYRLGQKPAADPSQRQRLAWEHLRMAFVEMENYYAMQTRRRLDKREEQTAA